MYHVSEVIETYFLYLTNTYLIFIKQNFNAIYH